MLYSLFWSCYTRCFGHVILVIVVLRGCLCSFNISWVGVSSKMRDGNVNVVFSGMGVILTFEGIILSVGGLMCG